MEKIKILDTFAGVGGFSLALEKAIGKENIEHIGFSEIDKFAKQVYMSHFPESKDLWDITKIEIENLPDFNLLTGGFPCQDVSVAGKQTLAGGRTILVEYLLQILEKKQPKYFIFENVKGLMSKKFDNFRNSIFQRIEKAGYNFKYQILNTKDFWLPQNRERIFIVWSLENLENFEFPKKKELKKYLDDIMEKNVDNKYYLKENQINNILKKIEIPKDYKNSFLDIYNKKIKHNWLCPTLTDPCHNSIRLLERPHGFNKWQIINNGISPTIRGQVNGNILFLENDIKIRKLTPIECERLQGFPDNWTIWVSDSQRCKQMGNAITVAVVKEIFFKLFVWEKI